MRWLCALRARAKLLLGRGTAESRLEQEFRFHVDMETEANERRGLPRAEARRRALVAFGGLDRYKERMRDERGGRDLGRLARDVAYSVRVLRRSPGYTAAAVGTLALGIGGVASIFSLVDAILLRPLPYPDSDRLVAIRHAAPGLGLSETGLSSGVYLRYRAEARSLETIELYTEAVVNLSGDDQAAERVSLAMVGPDFFDVVGVAPAVGRTFTDEEVARQDGMNVAGVLPVLLSHDLWLRRYGADPAVLGRLVDVNARPREVVGVLPEGFALPAPETQIWMLSVTPTVTANFARDLGYQAVARLRPGVTPGESEADLARALATIEGEYPDATATRVAEVRLEPIVRSLKDTIVADVAPVLWTLFGGMTLLLLVACANVANLVLARAHRRASESSLRAVLGARPADLLRLRVSESAVLALAGTGLAVVVAAAVVRLLPAWMPLELPRMDELLLGSRTLVFTIGVAAVAALAVSLPQLATSGRNGIAPGLRRSSSTLSDSRGARRLRGSLVSAQVAVSVTLLAGSVLMLRSFAHLMRVERGFDPEGLLVVDLGLPGSRAAAHERIFRALTERARALPGVTDAAGVNQPPLATSGWSSPLEYPLRRTDGPAATTDVDRPVAIRFFLPGYFQAMRTPVLEGTGLPSREAVDELHPVVLSRSLAARLFPGERAVGQRLRRLDATGGENVYRGPSGEETAQPNYVVVGVVADVRSHSLRDAHAEIAYLPVLEPRVDPGFVPTEMSLILRSDVAPLDLAPAVRDLVRDVDPILGIARMTTMNDIVSRSAAREQVTSLLLLATGLASLLLGAVGTYGVVSDWARQRTKEVGIRLALGAPAGEITSMVLLDSMRFAVAGGAIGLAAALAGGRLLGSLLFDVSPTDPLALSAVVVLVLATAAGATFGPAWAAARMDAGRAMRAE
jgi:predicted permease